MLHRTLRQPSPLLNHHTRLRHLVDADSELRKMFTASSQEWAHIVNLLANDRVTWKFPPSVPHFGRKGEADIKSVKFHFCYRRCVVHLRGTDDALDSSQSWTRARLPLFWMIPLTFPLLHRNIFSWVQHSLLLQNRLSRKYHNIDSHAYNYYDRWQNPFSNDGQVIFASTPDII